jgi:putative DNA primase/helicase
VSAIEDPRRRRESATGTVRHPSASEPVYAPEDPHRLATGFLAQLPDRTFRFWREEFVEWSEGGYTIRSDSEVKARLTRHCEEDFLRIYRDEMRAYEMRQRKEHPAAVRKVSTRLVGDVVQSLRAASLIPFDVKPPAWINGADGPDPLNLLPVRNGILDLTKAANGKPDALTPTTPDLFTFNPAAFDYNPKAPTPYVWLDFLDSLWSDDSESIEVLRTWFGYLLTPDTRQQKILFLLGPKRAGKGTISRILQELVGPGNVAGPTLNSFASNFGLSPLLDKSVAIIDDARLSHRTDAAAVTERLLTISGEGTITADRKYREPVTGKLNTRIVIISNELPKIGDCSGALTGRIVLLSLRQSFFGREDHGLFDRLKDELPGILNWAIVGWKQLRDLGRFVQPASGQEILQQFTDSTSPVGEFVREKCVVGAGERAEVDSLYREWRLWSEDNGFKDPGTKQTFGRNLLAAVPSLVPKHFGTDRNRRRGYAGIRLRRSDEPENTEDLTCPR